MRLFKFTFFVVFFLVLSCQKDFFDSNTKEYLKQYSDEKKPLAIDYFLPDGDTTVDQNKIVIHFTQPMIALSRLGQTVKTDLVDIEPKVKGSFKWANTKTLVYQAEGNLPFATDFTVKVLAGKESLLGFALLKDFVFSFSTPAPEIVSVSPVSGSKNIALRGPFIIGFNQKIDLESFKNNVELTHSDYSFGKSEKMAVEVECNLTAEEKKQGKKIYECASLLVKPKKDFAKNSQITVRVQKGVQGLEGHKVSDQDENYVFTTHGDFFVTGLECPQDCKPEASLWLTSTTPIEAKDFSQFVEFDPPLKDMKNLMGYWSNYDNRFSFYPNLKPNTSYVVKIKKGLQDIFGQILKEDKSFTIKTAHYNPSIYLPSLQDQVLHHHEDLDFGFSGMNLKTVTAFFKKMTSDADIIRFLYDPYTEILDLHAQEGFWNHTKDFTGLKTDEREFFSAKISEFTGNEKSLILLSDITSPQVLNYDYEAKVYNNRHHWMMRQITDLALDTKLSQKEGMVWVTSLTSGKNIAGAAVTVYDSFGNALFQGRTDAQGAVKIPGKFDLNTQSKFFNKENKNQSYYIFAKKDRDRAFMSTYWSDGLGYYYDSYDYEEEADETESEDEDSEKPKAVVPLAKQITLRAHLLTDRGLYKPGEEVRLKGYVRAVTDQGLKEYTKPLTLVIQEAYTDTKTQIDVTPNERGNFSVSYKISNASHLGYYNVSLSAKDEGTYFEYGSSSFQVERFRTPEFKVGVDFEKRDVVKGEPLAVKFSSEYLFGSPMKDASVKYFVNSHLGSWSPENSENWQFGRLYEHQYENQYDNEQSLPNRYVEESDKLDSNGEKMVSFETATDVVDVVRYAVDVEVSDLSGQIQAASNSLVVHPADFYIGGKLEKFFYDVSEKIPVFFAALTPTGEYLFDKQIQADLMRVKWVSVKRETLSGQFETVTEKKEEKLGECVKKSETTKNSCEFSVTESGYYFLKLSGKDSRGRLAVTEVPVYVSGPGYSYWPEEDSHELKMVLDKDKYQVGETAKILIKSPYQSGHALIAIERDKIISYEIKPLEGSSPLLEIPIKELYAPNVFVNVVLIKGALDVDPSQKDAKVSSSQALVKAGSVELVVKPKDKDITLAVTPGQKIYQPGDLAELNFKMEKPGKAEITVMVVDQGVLLAGGYQLANPLATLFAPYQHTMSQSDSRTHYVGVQGLDEKMAEPASGGGRVSGFRKEFIPLAYFNAEIETDEQGKASVIFTVPDQLTTFKIMAIANAHNDQFGLAESEFKTQKDIMIRPALPRFIRAGDVFESRVVLHNNTAQDMKIDVSAESNLKIISGAANSVMVPKNGSAFFMIQLESPLDETIAKFSENLDKGLTTDAPLAAHVNFTAKAGKLEDKVSIQVPNHFDRPEEVVATSGVFSDSVSEFIQKTEDVDERLGKLQIKLSANLLSKLIEKIRMLRVYPYDCLEQRISKAYPLVLFPRQDEFYQGTDADAVTRRNAVNDVLTYLAAQQSYQGEFKFWPSSLASSPALTLMAGEFLIHAKNAGFEVTNSIDKIRTRIFDYLKENADVFKHYDEHTKRSLRIHSLYVLHLLGEAQPSYYEGLKTFWTELESIDQARLVEMVYAQNSADPLVNQWLDGLKDQLRIKGHTAYLEPRTGSYYFGNSIKTTTARALQTLLKVNPGHPFVFQMLLGLVEEKKSSTYASSLESLEVMRTLHAYQQAFPDVQEAVLAKILMNENEIIQSTLNLRRPEDEISIPLAKLPKDMKLTFKKDSGSALFYDLKYHYVMKTSRAYGLEQGIALNREYYDLQGKKVDPAKLKHGETYQVVLNFFFSDQTDYLVVEEPVAAGLEPVNFALQTVRQNLAEGHSSGLKGYLAHKEFHDKKILLFSDSVPRGFVDFSYYVTATNAGDYQVPPAKAMEMYDPEIFGTTGSDHVVIH